MAQFVRKQRRECLRVGWVLGFKAGAEYSGRHDKCTVPQEQPAARKGYLEIAEKRSNKTKLFFLSKLILVEFRFLFCRGGGGGRWVDN